MLLTLVVLLPGCGRQPPPAAPPPPTVRVVRVEPRDVPIEREWLGTLEGSVTAQIRAEVTGYLQARDYDEGTLVHKGQLLFRIDPRPFEAALQQAQGQLGQAQAQLAKTELDVQRYTPLAAEGAVSREDLDNAIAAHRIAQANVTAAKAAVEQARLNLEFTRITAPIDGIAGLANAQIGDLVGPTGPVLTTISTVDPIKVLFTVSESEYLEYRRRYPTEAAQQRAASATVLHLILGNGELYPYTGRFLAAQRQVDVRTGAIQLTGLFPNPNLILRPGQFARVRAQTQVLKNALVVPQRAVTELQGGFQVHTVDAQNRVHIARVMVGERVGSGWVIQEGLSPGDRVIVEGTQKVRDGMTVTPEPYRPPAVPPSPAAPGLPPPSGGGGGRG